MKKLILAFIMIGSVAAHAEALNLRCDNRAGKTINVKLESKDCYIMHVRSDRMSVNKLACMSSQALGTVRDEVMVFGQKNGLSTLIRTRYVQTGRPDIGEFEQPSEIDGDVACTIALKH